MNIKTYRQFNESGNKITQERANYRFPSDIKTHVCENCKYYVSDGSCEIVQGVIDPKGVCDLHEAKLK